MTFIRDYSYYDGKIEITLQTPEVLYEPCFKCDGDGFCDCCGQDCNECDGYGETAVDYITVGALKNEFPDVYAEMKDAIQAIDRQRAFLQRRYGDWKQVETVRDYYEATS